MPLMSLQQVESTLRQSVPKTVARLERSGQLQSFVAEKQKELEETFETGLNQAMDRSRVFEIQDSMKRVQRLKELDAQARRGALDVTFAEMTDDETTE